MKRGALTFILILAFSISGKAQTMRFFEFATTCGHGKWQDTSFIASTSNQAVIDAVLDNLARPLNQRNFITGPIGYGNGGHNHNASHWFLWHFIPNEWSLADLSIEVCDGCPYSDVDANVTYWVGTIGQFCPWSGRPVREVSDPSLGINDLIFENEITLFPNPAKDEVNLKWSGLVDNVTASIYNCMGQKLNTTNLDQRHHTLDISNLVSGLYFVKISNGNRSAIKKLIVEGK